MMNSHIKYYLILLVILSSKNYLFAQNITDTVKIKEITILQNRDLTSSGINIIIIDSLTQENYSNNNLSDLLGDNCLVNIRDYGKGNIATASIRGANASHTQVRWNGININSPLTGQVDLSLIPIGFIDELMIKPGGSSIMDQSGGLGGSIVLTNSTKWQKGILLKHSQEIASFETSNSFIQIGYGTKRWHFQSRLMMREAKNNFPFINTALLPYEHTIQTNAETNQISQLHEIYYRSSEQDIISFIIWNNLMDRNIPSLMSYEGTEHIEKQNNNSTRSVLKWQKYIKHGSLHFQSGYIFETLNYFLEHSTLGGDITIANSESKTRSYLNQFKYNFEKRNSFSINLQLDWNNYFVNVKDKKSEIAFAKKRSELALFMGITKQLFKNLSSFIFVRNNLTDNLINPISPSMGFEYSPFKKHIFRIKAIVTRNFHLPTLNDLYYIPGGNPNLNPEKGLTEEINMIYTREINSVITKTHISLYLSHISDWILWRPTQFGYWTPENIQSVQSNGFEISNTTDGSLNTLKYSILSQYSFTKTINDSEDDFNNNEQLIYQPKNNFHLSLNLKNNKYTFAFTSSYSGKRYTSYGIDREYYALDSHWTHNVKLSKEIKFYKIKGELSLKVYNLFNKKYESIRLRAMPGRNYSINLKVIF